MAAGNFMLGWRKKGGASWKNSSDRGFFEGNGDLIQKKSRGGKLKIYYCNHNKLH
jgi:hypothetical protein